MKVSVMDEHIPVSQKTDDQVIKVGIKQHSSITQRTESQSKLNSWWSVVARGGLLPNIAERVRTRTGRLAYEMEGQKTV